MPSIEIENINLDVLPVSENYLVEEFTEGDDLIFETKFENSYDTEDIDFFTDSDNFAYNISISGGSRRLACQLSGPHIEVDSKIVKATWVWNTNGIRPGAYEAEAVITGPAEEIHICQTERPLAKAKKYSSQK